LKVNLLEKSAFQILDMFAVLGILPFAPFFVATPRSMKAKNDKED
jgi:hypothetical protein